MNSIKIMVIQKFKIEEEIMNFEESNQFVEQMEKNNKNKKNVLIVLVICAIIVVILFGVIGYIRQKDTEQLKMLVDGKEVAMKSTLLLQAQDGSYYMNVKELAEKLGYSYQKGEYKNYTEDTESCYLRTPYEIISMNANSNIITKYILNENSSATLSTNSNQEPEVSKDLVIVDEQTKEQKLNIVVDSENETAEIFSVDHPIQYVNDELYVAFEEVAKIFSVQFNISHYNSQLNRIRVNSIPQLVPSILQIAKQNGYAEVSNLYENLTALSDGMLVVGDGTKYGVISLTDGQEVISLKYDKIVYRQNTDEFFVTAEDSVGIVDKAGNTIVKPTAYDSIANLDEVNKLYLVEKNGKYGVVNRNGDTIVYAEYDSIGLKNPEEFSNEQIRNFNLLFETCIPVNYDGKVGIIDIEGNERLKCVYDSLGFVKKDLQDSEDDENDSRNSTTNTSNTTNMTNTTNEVTNTTRKNNTVISNDYESVLTIPESLGIKGIVVNLNGLYGIFDAEVKRLIIPCACSKIYAKTKSGVTKYYLEYNEQELDLENYLKENNLISVTNTSEEEEETNTISNTTTNTTANEIEE